MQITKEMLKRIIKEELENTMEYNLNEAMERYIQYTPRDNKFWIMLGNGNSIKFLYQYVGDMGDHLKKHFAEIANTQQKMDPKAAQDIASKISDGSVTAQELERFPIVSV